jgi:hypothetical protein
MERRSIIRASLVFLFLFLMLLPFMIKSFNVTNLSIADVSEETKLENEGFVIKSVDYVINGNSLDISYVLKEESGKPQELKVWYVLRYLDGEKVAEGEQNIVLGAGEEGSYKTTLRSPYDIKGFLRLALTVSSEKGSEWAVKYIDNSKSYVTITGFSISDERSGGWIAAISIIVLALITYSVVVYLYRHNARAKNSFPAYREKVFIPLDLREERKKRK